MRELWSYRELIYFLMLRDIKVRYKQTAVGAAWAVIQPVMTMVVFSIGSGTMAIPSQHLGRESAGQSAVRSVGYARCDRI